jgi:hypothetical protein
MAQKQPSAFLFFQFHSFYLHAQKPVRSCPFFFVDLYLIPLLKSFLRSLDKLG